MKTRNGRFLAAMLSAGGSEDATDFSDQGALAPQSACLIEEIAHLRSHISETRGGAKDNRVRFCKFIHRRYRYVCKAGSGGLGTVFFQGLIGDKLCHLVQRNFRARDLLHALRDALG